MSADDNFISRWSRRKSAARKGEGAEPESIKPAPEAARAAQGAGAVAEAPGSQAVQPLPPVDSLTFDSDFAAFMKEGVDPGLRRAALKTLLRDPRFNVMDGLDVYIDDYSKPDPLPEGWLEKLNQMKGLVHSVDEAQPGAQAETPPAGAASNAGEPGETEGEGESAQASPTVPRQPPPGPETPDGGQ